MTRLLRFGPVLSACLSLGACAQLIGLDKLDDKSAEGGTSGAGGKGGTGGQSPGGSGGRGGTGGSLAGRGGTAGGAGTTGGSSGESGASASGGKGGTDMGPAGTAGMEEGGASGAGASGGKGGTGGTGGSVENGGAGAGGEATGGCSSTIEITTYGYPAVDDSTTPDPPYSPYYGYTYYFNPELGTPDTDYLWVNFYIGPQYNGQQTGHFVLGTGDEANYVSCSRCVYIGQDDSANGAAVYYYAKSGTMDIAGNSKQTTGKPDVTLTDVLFTEVTLDDNSVSTEVPNGRCLHLATAKIKLTIPTTWTCSNAYYGTDDGCDCGCGAQDPDCTSAFVGACDLASCGDNGSCTDDFCSDVTLANNATCTSNQGWTCEPTYYGDGQTCDCGCGIVDVDCASADKADCGYCADPNACTATHGSDCSDIDAVDNSKCD